MSRRTVNAAVGALVLVAVGLVGPVAAASPRPGAPVPEGFRARSMDWVTPEQGWVLGTAPCPEGTEECATAIRTGDGGATWRRAGVLPAPLAWVNAPGVTEIEMAGPALGWAHGPDVYLTPDGGRTWKPADVPGGGERVLAMAADRRHVYAVVSPCPVGEEPDQCVAPATLWSSAPALAALGIWQQVPVALPAVLDATLALEGSSAYVLAVQPPSPAAFFATEDGRTWSPRPSPCAEGGDETLVDVAPQDEQRVALLCVGGAGFGKSVKTAYRSDDNARTTTPAGMAPEPGILSELAVAPGGTLLMASVSYGDWIYRNDGGTTWTTPLELGEGQGWAEPTFTTEETAFVVNGPVVNGYGAGLLYATHDAGLTWAPVDLAAPDETVGRG